MTCPSRYDFRLPLASLPYLASLALPNFPLPDNTTDHVMHTLAASRMHAWGAVAGCEPNACMGRRLRATAAGTLQRWLPTAAARWLPATASG